jgi:lipocalin
LFASNDSEKGRSKFRERKYLGKWYEILILNSRGKNIEYSLKDNGTIKVDNKATCVTNEAKHRKSKVCEEENVAMLKVSFFGPWGYNVVAIDKV